VKVLVTGSGGFIGSHLTNFLLNSGIEVLGIDNYNNYYAPTYKRLRFENVVGEHINFKSWELDLCDYKKTREIINDFSPDSVIHLAGQAGVRLPKEQNFKYIESNITAFCNVLDATINQGVKSFLYASSSSVYGNSKEFPLSEDTINLQPISFYGSTKLANEFLASKLSNSAETNILGMRFFSVYGPWGRPDMAYFKIVRALYTGTQFNIFGSGSQIRDMTHVWDVVKTVSLLQDKNLSDPLTAPNIVNIGGGHPHSLRKLIETLEIASGLNLKQKTNPASELDVIRTEADFSRLHNMINFKPKIDIEQGSQSLVEWASEALVLKNLKNWSE
jgi:UDP-glucuronate 4-epimerase